MSEILRLVIPVNLKKTNPNTSQHFMRLHQHKKMLKTDAYNLWLVAGRPRSKAPVVVSVTARVWKQMDRDNILASLKAAFDGLFKGAVVPDDSSDWVSFGKIEQENGPQWRRCPEVEIIVEVAS